MITSGWWIRPLHILLGVSVVAVGAWLAWGSLPFTWMLCVMVVVGGVLSWQARTIGLVWSWTTLLLGIESIVWPLVTVLQIRQSTAEPTDDQMGMILSSVVIGLFSSVFWLSFSYGLFKRAAKDTAGLSSTTPTSRADQDAPRRRKKK